MDSLRNFGFLLKEVSRRYGQRFEQRACGMALTLTQCKTLTRLEKHEGINQATLAELVEVEPMAMVRILDRMEADALIERRPDPADRRARSLFLTRKGRALLSEVWSLAEATRAETFAGISRPDRDVFLGMLEQMYRNLCALGEAPEKGTETQAASTAGSTRRFKRKARS
jgi:DNA-binding MarR family transcriptional regulator